MAYKSIQRGLRIEESGGFRKDFQLVLQTFKQFTPLCLFTVFSMMLIMATGLMLFSYVGD